VATAGHELAVAEVDQRLRALGALASVRARSGEKNGLW